jgi:acetate kinase
MNVLALNAGSSSLKFALFGVDDRGEEHELARGAMDREGDTPLPSLIPGVFAHLSELGLPRPEAVGHRLVHGGPDHVRPTLFDARLRSDLEGAIRFAPLHLPAALAIVDAVSGLAPDLPQVACFDTAFHRDMPERARRLPLSRELHDAGIRRYGFHGLSFEHVVATVGAQALGRAVIAHLGSGSSLVAIRDGCSVDTSMGLSPTGGTLMGTRSGDLDPGVLLHAIRHLGYDATKLDAAVNAHAGLLGISETSADMRQLLEARASDPRAALAVEMYCYSVRKFVGAYAAALGGLDTLVFTGGIGERSAVIRSEICAGLDWMGFRVLVVRADEERMIARHTARVMAHPGTCPRVQRGRELREK